MFKITAIRWFFQKSEIRAHNPYYKCMCFRYVTEFAFCFLVSGYEVSFIKPMGHRFGDIDLF